MKIICLNGWGGKMHDALLPYLKHEQPDILCLQEVVHSPATSEPELTYRDGDHVLPQRANFFADVCAVLPSHAASFCPAAQGVLWDGDTSVPSQWGLATFVSRDLPVIGQAKVLCTRPTAQTATAITRDRAVPMWCGFMTMKWAAA
ncbi:hypothetical protein [Sulfitobacter mediterraneus]|uniref:hypothetical protein n=1 Tax=Sulfitobacter mediterraneus TaxID=83219 RepID=UPI0021A9123F|nr:hypothetical protein [Sulfitobacter mediterraneus]